MASLSRQAGAGIESLAPRAMAWMCLVLTQAAGALGGVQAAGSPPVPRTMRLPAFPVAQLFDVPRPDAAVSPASRSMEGAMQPGYIIHARVVVNLQGVEADAASMLKAAPRLAQLLAPTDVVAPVDGAPGFWTISTGSITSAVARCESILAAHAAAEAYLDIQQPLPLRSIVNDPGFAQQWHLSNTANGLFDINVEPAWLAGYTGAGVTVGIVEGGFEFTHPDLAANYNAAASQAAGSATFHGTSVAGVVAATGNNALGGVGVAWGAGISKQVYGSPSQNATALGYRNDLNAIKNNSWGPSDNGAISYITSVELAALRSAVSLGRGGKGEILVWAAGNGGTADRIDYDPYASSRYVLPIGGIGDQDVRSSFNESGSAMFMVAQTSGNVRNIYTTDYTGVNGFSTTDYTDTFGGTSSAAPLAAGAIACILQANPDLSWRDVQHLLIETARRCHPTSPSWTQNGAGRWVSYDYGYGAIDLGAAALAAPGWIRVRPEIQKPTTPQLVGVPIPDNSAAGITRTITVSGNLRVEAVEVTVNILTTNVGDLEIVLTSPSGTQSILAAAPRNDSQDNLSNYTFTTRRHWDESAGGAWTLRVADRRAGEQGTWVSWSLNVTGSPCPADVDGSGFVDINDFDTFVGLFESGSALADFDRTGFVDIEDFDAFVHAFEKGC